MIQTFQIIITSFAITFSTFMVAFNLNKSEGNHLLRKYCIFFCVILLWSLGELILSIAPSIYMFSFFKYIAIFLITPFIVLFCHSYTVNTIKIIRKFQIKFKIIMFFIFATIIIVFITNPYQEVTVFTRDGMRTGLLFLVLMIILYMFLLLSLLMLSVHILKRYGYYKKQTYIIVSTLIISVIIVSINYQVGLSKILLLFDIAPVFFLIPVFILNITALKYRLFCITPIAFPKMTDVLREAILIIDIKGIIAYFNQSFKNMFIQCPGLNLDNNVNDFLDYLINFIDMDSDSTKIIDSIRNGLQEVIMGEISLKDAESIYSVNIKPLQVKGTFQGRVVTFIDITEHKNLLNEVKRNNDRLKELNEQLADYVNKVGELAAVKERNKLTSEVHDSVGHTMTVLISLIGVSSMLCDKDIGEVKQKLGQMMEIAMKGHEELRHSVLGVVPKRIEEQGIVKKIGVLVKEFEKTGVKVDFTVDGIESTDTAKYGNLIHRVCKEALTNSLKHGKADQVNIILRFTVKKINLFIFDDGIGTNEINKGLGLSGMEKRVKEVNGLISYGSDGERGFNICIEIPVTNA
ncbi:MAG: histidine kinase N-terminal 7TM domain-containing protein [Bacillota bacterium]|nr:histidine kinase N-terminal 7TM domain-containing protein [Bacillota bacterium]